MEENVISEKEYFKSDIHKIIFALIYTDMSLREKLLGISEELYLDKVKAKKWRNALSKKIHPDRCKVIGAGDAFKRLNELYARMTEVDDEYGDIDE